MLLTGLIDCSLLTNLLVKVLGVDLNSHPFDQICNHLGHLFVTFTTVGPLTTIVLDELPERRHLFGWANGGSFGFYALFRGFLIRVGRLTFDTRRIGSGIRLLQDDNFAESFEGIF